MARRRRAEKRELLPDVKYNSLLVQKAVNMIMREGKKSKAQKILYSALDILKEKIKGDSLKLFEKAVNNVKPVLEVKSRRVGGATYQVPVEVSAERRTTMALRWLVDLAQARKGAAMEECLATELVDAYNNVGSAIKKRDDTHKMAEANKAFAHYRW